MSATGFEIAWTFLARARSAARQLPRPRRCHATMDGGPAMSASPHRPAAHRLSVGISRSSSRTRFSIRPIPCWSTTLDRLGETSPASRDGLHRRPCRRRRCPRLPAGRRLFRRASEPVGTGRRRRHIVPGGEAIKNDFSLVDHFMRQHARGASRPAVASSSSSAAARSWMPWASPRRSSIAGCARCACRPPCSARTTPAWG